MIFSGVEKESYRKLFELVSEDIMGMAAYWSGSEVENTLSSRQEFVNRALNNFMVKDSKIFPVNEVNFPYRVPNINQFTEGSLMLVYDTALAKNLVSTNLSEFPYDMCPMYDATPAFYLGYYIGWEISFFETIEQVETFIKKNSQFVHYSLYYQDKKVPIRFGYFQNTRRVYCSEVDFYDHHQTAFIELQDFFLLTLDGVSDYYICHSNQEIVKTLVRMVPKESRHKKIENTDIDLGDFRLKDRYEVSIATRLKEYNGVLVFDPDDEHPPVLTFNPTETNLPFNFSQSYFNPFTSSSIGCWVECRAFERFMAGELVSKEDLCSDLVACENCPIKKFQGIS